MVEPLRAQLTELRLALRTPLGTGAGAIAFRTVLLLEVTDADGTTGVGESAPLPQAGTEDVSESRRALTAFIEEGVPPHAGRTPAAAAAVELALLDLAGRKAGLPLHRHLGRPAASHVTVNALLSAETPSDLAAQAEAHVRQGFLTLKLKVGARGETFAASLERDLSRVAAVRSAVGQDVRLRLDANGAWAFDEARRALEALAPFGPEFVEQPIPAGPDDAELLAALRAEVGVPIVVDESVVGERELERLLAADAADAVVLKPMRLGGLEPALACAARAQDAGLPVVITTFLGSAVERSAALHLAAVVSPGNADDVAHGLATGALLAEDVAAGPEPVGGRLVVPLLPGHGVVLP